MFFSNRLFQVLGVSCLLLLSSCCDCVDIGCFIQTPELIFQAQVGLQADFREEDLQEVFVVRTTKDFQRLDSAAYAFAPEAFGSDIYTIFVTEGPFNLAENESFKDFNYLIVNRAVAQVDTLENMSYTLIETVESCENCSGLFCSSDDLIRREYRDFQVQFNGTLFSELEIQYFRK